MPDRNCPYRIFQGEDLMRVSNGDDYCTADCRGREILDEYGASTDYYICDSGNHESCSWFLRQIESQKEKNTELLESLFASKP